jgi:hypothetical protein
MSDHEGSSGVRCKRASTSTAHAHIRYARIGAHVLTQVAHARAQTYTR